MATYVGVMKVDGTNELPVGSTLYGTCSTAAATAQKDVTLANFDKLITGVTVHVKFTNSNTVASPKLKVGSTAATAIMRYGTTAPSTSAATSWNAGAVISFTYDGTYWMMNDWLTDGNSNTWRNITVNGSSWKGTGTGTGALNFVNGTNVTITSSGNDLTISAAGGGSTITTATASLTTSGWSSNTQSVTVTGVTASNTVIVSPAPASMTTWANAGVYCSAQAANSLTFTCTSTPAAAITVNVVII